MSVHDRWHGERTGPGKRWEVRYRDGGVQRKRRFESRAAAERFEAKRRLDPEVRHALEARTLTVGQMMSTWLATKARMRPKTVEACTLDAREVRAAFGDRLAVSVRASEVRVWVARDRGASIRRRSLAALRQAYRFAIADGLVLRDPTEGIPLPKQAESTRRALTWVQLEQLAVEAGAYGPMVWLLGTCGLRIGEACALDVADVGTARLRVRRSKTGKARDVPIMPSVRDMLDLSEPGPLFKSPTGLRVNAHHWRARVFEPAAVRAGLGHLTPHEMRHTAASLANQSGADVTVVARMLGHDPAVCLKIYAHLFDSSLDSVVARMEAAHAGGAEVIPLDRKGQARPRFKR